MRTAAYCRYSSDAQRETSIRDQLRNIEDYCDRMSWPRPALFQDQAISGARIDRPGYQGMMDAARQGVFEVLLVDDFSRLSRDHIEAAQAVRTLKFLGIRLIGVSDGLDTARQSYKLETGMRGLMAELYLDDLAEKTHRGLMGQALDGYSAGGLPYGYRSASDGRGFRRSIYETQAEWVRWIFAQYIAGQTPRAIVAELNRQSVPSPRGGKWAATAIYPDAKGVGLLGNAIYNGRQIWNKTKWVKDPATGRRRRTLRPPSDWIITEHDELKIIDDDTWTAAEARTRAIRARTSQRQQQQGHQASGGRGPKYLFSGLLRCGCCGGAYVVIDRYRYGCAMNRDRGESACANNQRIARATVEQVLLAGIKAELLSEAAYKAFEEEARRLLKEHQPDPADARRAAQKAKVEIDNIMAAIRAGIITPSTKQALEDVEARLQDAERQVREIQSCQPAQILPRAREIHRSMVEQLERIEDVSAAREALRAIVGEIRLMPENGELWAEMTQGGMAALCQLSVVAGARFELATFGL
jgi:site-specific DNA recombinase